MVGQVKITVIATGFDREGAEPTVERANANTPIDMQRYAAWQHEESPAGANQTFTVSRRPRITLPIPDPLALDQVGETLLDMDAESGAEMDVPAFLRQRSE